MEGLYLYGIVNTPPSFYLGVAGLGGRAVYLIPYRGLAAVVSDSPFCPYPINAENAATHEAVVEAVMVSQTILPMRFNTILVGRDRVLSMLAEHYGAFQADLLRLQDKVEMGLKVIWEDKPKKEGSRLGYHSFLDLKEEDYGPGQSYLLAKWAEHVITEAIRDQGDSFISRIQANLIPLSVENIIRRFPTERLLLDASYLVEGKGQGAFCAGVEQLEEEMADLCFLLTGPWPPYSFVRASNR